MDLKKKTVTDTIILNTIKAESTYKCGLSLQYLLIHSNTLIQTHSNTRIHTAREFSIFTVSDI